MLSPDQVKTVETYEQVHKVSFAVTEIQAATILLTEGVAALGLARSRVKPNEVADAALTVCTQANAITQLAAAICKGLGKPTPTGERT